MKQQFLEHSLDQCCINIVERIMVDSEGVSEMLSATNGDTLKNLLQLAFNHGVTAGILTGTDHAEFVSKDPHYDLLKTLALATSNIDEFTSALENLSTHAFNIAKAIDYKPTKK